MQCLALELRTHGGDDFGMAVSDVEDTETAETVDIFPPVDVREDVAGIRPFDRCVERTAGAGFAVFQKTGVYVIAETVDGLADDPIRLRAIDRFGVD